MLVVNSNEVVVIKVACGAVDNGDFIVVIEDNIEDVCDVAVVQEAKDGTYRLWE